MIISVINFSKKISDFELQTVLRAINRQLAEDCEPYWHRSGEMRLEGKEYVLADGDVVHFRFNV